MTFNESDDRDNEFNGIATKISIRDVTDSGKECDQPKGCVEQTTNSFASPVRYLLGGIAKHCGKRDDSNEVDHENRHRVYVGIEKRDPDGRYI